jgi:uncharacterized protein (TIGR02145 family)
MVREKSDNTQTPWESTSLEGDFYFSQTEGSEFKEDDHPEKDSSVSIGSKFDRDIGDFIDIRDNQQYSWVKIGEQIWMSENLGYNSTGSWNNYFFGRLFDWNSISDVCPDGWHLPSDQEWITLEVNLGMRPVEVGKYGYRGTNEGGKLKEQGTENWNAPNTGATNESGFSAMAGGLYLIDVIIYKGEEAHFWTSTKESLSKGYSRRIDFDKATIFRDQMPLDRGLSVRCVKD